MNKRFELPVPAAFDNEDSNTSSNPSFQTVLDARLSRRNILRGSLGSALTAALGAVSLTACGGSDDPAPAPAETLLGFTAVPKSLAV